MVIRYLCRCLTCGHAHTLRIAMGFSPVQRHSFSCGGCGEEMSIEVTQKPEIANADIRCVSNCEENDEEGLIINLHPDYLIPEDQLHVDMAFPWLEQVLNVAERQMELGATMPKFSSFDEFRHFALEIQTIQERWDIIKKVWSLSRNSQHDLARTILENYKFEDTSTLPTLQEALFHFCGMFLNRGLLPLFTDVAEFVSDSRKKTPEEFRRFKRVHNNDWFSGHLDNYFDIFSEYFREFGEYSQALLVCQYGLPIPENAVATSTSFARTKMFYGNAFEVLTSHFVVLACLNNISHGRSFDEFQNMNLKKYLTTNKAMRANPFSETKPLAAFSSLLDSTLRNASHHGAIKIDQLRRQISYRSGGSGAERKMRYSEYLVLCNDLILKLAALLMLELILESKGSASQ